MAIRVVLSQARSALRHSMRKRKTYHSKAAIIIGLIKQPMEATVRVVVQEAPWAAAIITTSSETRARTSEVRASAEEVAIAAVGVSHPQPSMKEEFIKATTAVVATRAREEQAARKEMVLSSKEVPEINTMVVASTWVAEETRVITIITTREATSTQAAKASTTIRVAIITIIIERVAAVGAAEASKEGQAEIATTSRIGAKITTITILFTTRTLSAVMDPTTVIKVAGTKVELSTRQPLLTMPITITRTLSSSSNSSSRSPILSSRLLKSTST